jgi:predicted membrane-bound mannosyltransferase
MKKKVNRVKKKEEQKPKIEEQTPIIEAQKPIIEEPITKDNGRWTADNLWLIGCLVIAAIAVFWRFYWLELKPFHHDEGVNGFFMSTLVRDGIYKYDPSNYHGPTLYYIALAFAKAFGFNTISMRASVAIFGVLTVVMAFFLKNYIGRIGSLTAALLLALSPWYGLYLALFYPRDFLCLLQFRHRSRRFVFYRKTQSGNFRRRHDDCAFVDLLFAVGT